MGQPRTYSFLFEFHLPSSPVFRSMRLSILSLTFFAIPVAFAQQLRLDSSCDAKVNGWVDEALFLLDRASKVLKEATKRDTSMQPNYKEVLDAFLGADAGVDVYKAVQGRFSMHRRERAILILTVFVKQLGWKKLLLPPGLRIYSYVAEKPATSERDNSTLRILTLNKNNGYSLSPSIVCTQR